MIIYTAPVIMGSSGRPLFDLDIQSMDERIKLNFQSMKKMGEDWRMIVRQVDIGDS